MQVSEEIIYNPDRLGMVIKNDLLPRPKHPNLLHTQANKDNTTRQ